MKTLCFSVVFSLLGVLPPAAQADVIKALPGKSLPEAVTAKSARGVDVEAATQNPQPAFLVRVSVDRASGIYEQGELMQVSVESEKTGYLYLLYKQADDTNKITGGRKITLPTTTSRFQLRIAPPLGAELLIALVTLQPLTDKPFGGKSLTASAVTDIDLDTLIEKGVRVELRDKPRTWAEHCVRIKTVARSERDTKPAAHKRIGLFVGVSKYKHHPRIRNLSICHLDAQVMAKLMQDHCRLDGAAVLIDEQATRQAIEQAFVDLRQKSKPGDEIFIYWSGHGAKCAATGPGEPDGMDEFLVPHDGRPDDVQGTMVLDDTLGRWVQALDGRKVCMILDACHSGGQAAGKGLGDADDGEKSVGAGGGLDALISAVAGVAAGGKSVDALGWQPLGSPSDFLGGKLGRMKDLGQDDADMLFSSASDEISAERRDGKLSVMTYYLAEKLLASSSLTLEQAYEHVRVEVPKYMQANFPGRQQTPLLVPAQGGKKVNLR